MIMIGNRPAKYLRHYIPEDHKFVFLDDEYNMVPVINETKAIYNKIKAIEGERFGYTEN